MQKKNYGKEKVFCILVSLICIFTTILLTVCYDKCNEIYDNNNLISSKDREYTGRIIRTRGMLVSFDREIKRFTGITTIIRLSLPSNPIFDIDLTIEKGRFKVVLVQEDDVYIIIDKSYKGLIELELPSGDYALKLVGQDAGFELKLSFEEFSYNTKTAWRF